MSSYVERTLAAFERTLAAFERFEEENEKLIVKLNAEHIVRQNVEAENAKLRELLVDAYGYINHPADASWTHMRRKEARDSLNGRIRELGIGVTDS